MLRNTIIRSINLSICSSEYYRWKSSVSFSYNVEKVDIYVNRIRDWFYAKLYGETANSRRSSIPYTKRLIIEQIRGCICVAIDVEIHCLPWTTGYCISADVPISRFPIWAGYPKFLVETFLRRNLVRMKLYNCILISYDSIINSGN